MDNREGGSLPSRSNFNGGSIGNGTPDFFDFLIRDSDAAIRPILAPVERTDPSRTIWQSVNHDVASGRNAARRGLRNIVLIRIGNVQGEMEIAVRFPPVDGVGAFRSAMISFVCFGPTGTLPRATR